MAFASDDSVVNAAIRRALHDAQATLDEKGVLVVAHLEATQSFERAGPALPQALYTLFRGLAERLGDGATLTVSTLDRAGGDIEVAWEAKELPGASEDASTRRAIASGPYGDLLELAISGLETICRVRATHSASAAAAPAPSSALRLPSGVRRRYTFLLPAPERWAERAP